MRSQLVRVVVVALLPLLLLAMWQAWIVFQESRDVVASRLRANAWGVAEQQRDPFIIAQNALAIAARQPEVRSMGARCSAILADVKEGSTEIINYVRTDADGRARCSVLPFKPGTDLSRDPWWIERGDRRTLYLAKPQMGTISGEMMWLMVLPLFAPNSDFQGTVSAGISIDGLSALVHRVENNFPGALLITDGKGNPVIGSKKVRFGRLDQIAAAQSTPELVRINGGGDWTYVSAPLFRDQLYVVYAEPSRNVTNAALSRIWPSLLLPILALALSSAAIWYATRRSILRWLDLLRAITARFARGDFTRELSAFDQAPRELAEFAADLHQMADAIGMEQDKLRTALANNLALTSEVNHRVRNNLQIVVSMLTLQADRLTEPRAAQALHQARSRITALSLVHRLMYTGEGVEERGHVSLEQLVPQLCSQLRNNNRQHHTITLTCHTQDIVVTADQAVALTMFVVEAVTNAYIHAFAPQQHGTILVEVTSEEETGIVIVSDDGNGFAADVPSASIGLDLIQGFAEQVEGIADVATGPQGTRVTLSFAILAQDV